MIVLCPSCETHLQFDDKNSVPVRLLSAVRKCRTVVRGKSGGNTDIKDDIPGPNLVSASSNRTPPLPGGAADDLLRMLSALLQKGDPKNGSGYGWDEKQALVCVGTDRRELASQVLRNAKYNVEAPVEKALAVDILRDRHMDLVLLDDYFDANAHGAEAVRQEVQRLRPNDRRRVYLVYLSETGRTLDQLAAFLENVNLIVNPADLAHLPQALERSLRDYNDLYRHFNNALGVSPM